ncbi:amidohydrolase [Sporolactobacillus sp. CPB3-1]|uniref:Amidohydrolase n=1 Tax=Sporolactobacillus mangiferae TaxID=2940498 RepID=A0ABT0M988_9BACL|nr:amidohydrolase [Sporolactobacillus mangiferae]MCL1631426.1 amidohydrolase [Sporolactobacillus mangiferae]
MKLWTNGTFYTMKKSGQVARSVLTDHGQIIAVGRAADTAAQKLHAETVDLQGNVVFPGFVDSHMHLLWYGQALDRLNLSSFTTKAACLEAIRQRAAILKDGEWLFVEGYDDNSLTGSPGLLTRHDLDPISNTHPILVRRIDYHTVSVNTPFMHKIGLKRHQIFSGGGMIDLDVDGWPTGVLRDEASMLAIERFPTEDTKELERLLQIAVRDLWKKGITGAHSEDLHYFNGFSGTVQAFRNVLSAKFPFRAHLLIHHRELGAYLHAPESIKDPTAFVSLGAMKIFYDGTVGSRTAFMTHPYAGEPDNYGLRFHSEEEFEALVRQARWAHLPIAVHIIGDRAFEEVIRVLRAYPPLPGQKDRMIHTPWLRPRMLEEAAGLPLIFDIQPQFMSSDLPWALDVLGPNRPPLSFAWKTIQNCGFRTSGGSDAPIEVPNPFLSIHAAVTRTCDADPDGKHYFSEEALSVFDAIALYTKGSAAACGADERFGTIEPGRAADFTMTDQNPFLVPHAYLRNLSVTKTVVNEQIVFDRAAQS